MKRSGEEALTQGSEGSGTKGYGQGKREEAKEEAGWVGG